MNNNKISYFNTLIFTIVSSIVSVILLLLLFLKGFRPYLPFFITIEIGIFTIIGLCIAMIVINEKRKNEDKAKALQNFTFNSCPDYYLQKNVGQDEICSNEYIIQDSNKKKYIMKIYPNSSDFPSSILPTVHSYEYLGTEPKHEKFKLNELMGEKTLTTPAQKCGPLFTEPTDTNLQYLKGYTAVPWITAWAKCDSL